MFVSKVIAAALANSMSNKRNLPINEVRDELAIQVHNVLATTRPAEWTSILVETFRSLVETSVHLPTVGKLCNLLVALDHGKCFSFDEITALCEKEDYAGITEIFDHYAGIEA